MKNSKKKIFKKTALIILAILIIIQFFRIDKSTPNIEQEKDFIIMTSAPDNVSAILKVSCYDCHSYTTNYPWYSEIAPISWWMKKHIDEGREHLNFSVWSEYSSKTIDEKLEECEEEVEEGEMPLRSYTLTHGDAKLSQDQKITLVNFFKSLKTKELYNESHEESHEESYEESDDD